MAVGCALGVSQGKIGKFMCYGLVFGMILGVGIGTVIEKSGIKNEKSKLLKAPGKSDSMGYNGNLEVLYR